MDALFPGFFYVISAVILFGLKNWACNSLENYKLIVNDIKTMRARPREVIDGRQKTVTWNKTLPKQPGCGISFEMSNFQ